MWQIQLQGSLCPQVLPREITVKYSLDELFSQDNVRSGTIHVCVLNGIRRGKKNLTLGIHPQMLFDSFTTFPDLTLANLSKGWKSPSWSGINYLPSLWNKFAEALCDSRQHAVHSQSSEGVHVAFLFDSAQ